MTTSNGPINPLHRDIIRAAKIGDARSLNTLLCHKIPAKVLTNALCYSAGNSNLPSCRVLLNNGADVNGVGLNGSAPLSIAAGNLDVEIVNFLLQHGADVNTRDDIGRTPLLSAILAFGDVDLIRLLLEAGGDVNLADSRGLTPLWATMLYNGNYQIIGLLLEHGADATVQYFGRLLIDVARKNGLVEMEKILAAF